ASLCASAASAQLAWGLATAAGGNRTYRPYRDVPDRNRTRTGPYRPYRTVSDLHRPAGLL
ncbi:unnamed protein product, partial [Lota lota]